MLDMHGGVPVEYANSQGGRKNQNGRKSRKDNPESSGKLKKGDGSSGTLWKGEQARLDNVRVGLHLEAFYLA